MKSIWNVLMPSRPEVTQRAVAGVSTRVVVLGRHNRARGVVLCVHGASGHLENFAYNLAELARTHMVIAYDLPWHGLSGRPDSYYEIRDHARHLWALADDLEVADVHLIGHSVGGWIAGYAQRTQPQRVLSLVLIGSAGADGPAYPGNGSMREQLSGEFSADLIRTRLRFAVGPRHPVPEELVQFRAVVYSGDRWPEQVAAFTYHRDPGVWERNIITEDQWRQVACPTLLIWGSADRVIAPELGRRLSAWIPGCCLEIIPGAGHMPQFEEPERTNALIAQHLLAHQRVGTA